MATSWCVGRLRLGLRCGDAYAACSRAPCSSRPAGTRVRTPGVLDPVVTGRWRRGCQRGSRPYAGRGDVNYRSRGAAARPAQRVCGAGPAGGECARGSQPGAGAARGCRGGEERVAGLSGAARVGVRDRPGGRDRVGDGACVRGVAAAVRAVVGSPGASSRPAARCAGHRVRFARRGCAGSVPGRPGGPESALGRRGTATADLHRGRRAVAGRGLSSGAGVRRAASRCGVGRAGLRRARAGRRADFEGLSELFVGGLDDGDAHELLATVLTGPLDERVRDRIVAETRGNPLALLELPRGWTPAELAVGSGCPTAARCRGGSSRASRSGWRRCRPRRVFCFSSPRRSRWGIRCWCGGRQRSSASGRTRRRRPPPRDCSISARRCASVIRLCVRR